MDIDACRSSRACMDGYRFGSSGVSPSSTCFGPAAAPLHLQGTSAASCCTQVRASRQTGARSNSQQGSRCTKSDKHTHRRQSQQAGCCTGPATATPQPQLQSQAPKKDRHVATGRKLAGAQCEQSSAAGGGEESDRLTVHTIALQLHTAHYPPLCTLSAPSPCTSTRT